MTTMERMQRQAELVAEVRDGSSIKYEKFDPDDWKGDRSKSEPAKSDLYVRQEWHEEAVLPKDMAAQLIGLIAHVKATADNLDAIVSVLPAKDAASRALVAELKVQIHALTHSPGE